MSDETAAQPQASAAPPSEKELELLELQHAMFRMLAERLQKNLEAFRKYIPAVADAFTAFVPSGRMKFVCGENGVPNLFAEDRQNLFYPSDDPFAFCESQVTRHLAEVPVMLPFYAHSADWGGLLHHRYMNEIVGITDNYPRRSLTANDTGALAHCVMIGCGLGYHLAFLYGRMEIANLVLIEPDPDIFYASLQAYDWASLLKFLFANHLGINIMVGQTADQVMGDMHEYYVRHGRFLASQRWLYLHYISPQTEAVRKALERDYRRHYDSMGFFDDELMGLGQGTHAVLSRSRFIRRDAKMPVWCAQCPAFVVANGPSLDRDLDFIRRMQDRAVIFACGTALDSLYHAGVIPDFYCVTERLPQVAQSIAACIDDLTVLDDIVLLGAEVVHPDTLRLFRNHGLFAKSDEPFFWLVRLMLEDEGAKMLPVGVMNPLVGNMGVSAAIALGFKRLYLFGFDNGTRIDAEQLHSAHSALYSGKYEYNRIFADPDLDTLAPANFGGWCKTHSLYISSRRNIELTLANAGKDGVCCFNCSDGVATENAAALHSSDIDTAAWEVLPKANMRRSFTEDMTFAFSITREQLDAVMNYPGFDSLVADLSAVFAERPKNRLEFVQKMESSTEINAARGASRPEYFLSRMLAGSMQCMFMMVTTALFHSRDEAACLHDANRMIDLYLHFLNDAKSLFRHAPDYVIGAHQKYLGGKVGGDYPDSKAPVVPELKPLIKSVTG